MLTTIYALMHFLVDFICAWAMFGFFQRGEAAYLNLLIYNFCAFALQMPLGTLLDLARSNAKDRLRPWLAPIWTGIGVALTVGGALTHPALLGIGNALFHVGGGLDVTVEDFAKKQGGKYLGIFVAPGAIGLFFGTQLGKSSSDYLVLILSGCVLMALLGMLLLRRSGLSESTEASLPEAGKGSLPVLIICCFAVVILRSWIGFETSFDWKSSLIYGLLAVLAVALGKATGGFLSARFGAGKTMAASLLLATGCFLLGEIPVFGFAALLLFNMSMPVTLYLLARNLPKLPGFAFGLLTFGLFLGFLPVYAGMSLPVSGGIIGAVGSIVSAVLLMAARRAEEHGKISA